MTVQERAQSSAAYAARRERDSIILYRAIIEGHRNGHRLMEVTGKLCVCGGFDPSYNIPNILPDILAPLMPSIELALVERLKAIVDAYEAEHGKDGDA